MIFFRNNKYYLADKCIDLAIQFDINAVFSVTLSSGIGLSTANLLYNAGRMLKLCQIKQIIQCDHKYVQEQQS